jgi:IclR family acetate operon transcriptional repressor
LNVVWDEKRLSRKVVGAALLDKALRLVDVIGSATGPVDVHYLLAETGWARTTLYRILSVLTVEGYVQREPGSRRYAIGYRFLELAQNAWAGSDLVVVASLDLQRLRNLTGETSYLAVPHDDGVLSLGKFESPHSVRSAAQLGTLKPYHCTSQGKAMLAAWDTAELDRKIGQGPLERFTDATIVDRRALDEQLAEIRTRGFAIENEEILTGRRCVGAAVLDERGRPLAAISVAGPAWRLTRERAEQLGPEVAEVARHIGQTLRSIRPARHATSGAWTVRGQAGFAFYGADPAWESSSSRLVWVDRMGQALHSTGDDQDEVLHLPPSLPISCALHQGERVLVFLAGETWIVDDGVARKSKELASLGALATCRGPDSTVWIARAGSEGCVIGKIVGTEFVPTWSLAARIGAMCCRSDGTVLATDPERGVIYAGQPGAPSMRILSRVSRASGEPRAITVDWADRLWVALYDGWAIGRVDENGELVESIPLPVPRPTGVVVGGEDGSTMFVTTARYGLDPAILREAPLSGSLLARRIDP